MSDTIRNIKRLLEIIKPYQGIIYFVVLLLAMHFLWKLVVVGDLQSQAISIFGIDMTAQFHQLSRWLAHICYWVAKWFPGGETLVLEDTLMYFTDRRMRIQIIWGCTGVKQLYIFITIILFYSGPLKDKLWYIPLGCVILCIYNVIRIVAICFLTKNHWDWFDFLHEGLFRYIYYGLIFVLWVIWEEKFVKRDTR